MSEYCSYYNLYRFFLKPNTALTVLCFLAKGRDEKQRSTLGFHKREREWGRERDRHARNGEWVHYKNRAERNRIAREEETGQKIEQVNFECNTHSYIHTHASKQQPYRHKNIDLSERRRRRRHQKEIECQCVFRMFIM